MIAIGKLPIYVRVASCRYSMVPFLSVPFDGPNMAPKSSPPPPFIPFHFWLYFSLYSLRTRFSAMLASFNFSPIFYFLLLFLLFFILLLPYASEFSYLFYMYVLCSLYHAFVFIRFLSLHLPLPRLSIESSLFLLIFLSFSFFSLFFQFLVHSRFCLPLQPRIFDRACRMLRQAVMEWENTGGGEEEEGRMSTWRKARKSWECDIWANRLLANIVQSTTAVDLIYSFVFVDRWTSLGGEEIRKHTDTGRGREERQTDRLKTASKWYC